MFFTYENILLEAQAMDVDGLVNEVEFFAGTNLLSRVASEPYRFIWSNAPAGVHTLLARATDNEGLTGQSTTNTITNMEPGLIQLTNAMAAPALAFSFEIKGKAGQVYQVQAADNLINDWTDVGRVTNTTGTATFTTQTNLPRQFYRAVLTR
jgi:hypothetical protein